MTLSPKEAAGIARKVYTVRTESDMQDAYEASGGLGIRDSFDVATSKRMTSTTGPRMLSSPSGFGFIATGKGSRQGEALIALRGTVTAADWWTDANIGLASGPNGHRVHSGFNRTYEPIGQAIQSYLGKNNVSVVHCVGHSLGGALATLAASSVAGSGTGVRLYTFGCPRVGTMGFTHSLTKNIGGDNIHRVFHTADPVSMIPIFPYLHAPFATPGLPIEWAGSRVAPSAHYMENYERSIGETQWHALRAAQPPDWEARAKAWLDTASSQTGMMGGFRTLWMITQALSWVMKKIAIAGLGLAATAAVTVLDQLASLLHKGAQMSIEIAGYVKTIIGSILKYLGRGVSAVANLTYSFVRWVLELLMRSLHTVVLTAVNAMR